MSDATTIKVSRALRDRLAAHARAGHVPLAVVIEKALDVSEERAFWERVRSANAVIDRPALDDYEATAPLNESLDDADDDAISRAGAW